MARLLVTETLLMLFTGLFTFLGIPWLRGFPPAWPLFLVGFLMAMSFVALYALANLAGRRLPTSARLLIGALAYLATFWGPLLLALGRFQQGGGLPVRIAYVNLAPPLFGLLLMAMAALVNRGGGRVAGVGAALFAYAVPMLGVRYALVTLLGVNPDAQLIALQSGAFYLFLRGLVRVASPTSAEGNREAGPLVYRPVPDRIVGLVEGTSRRPARPYATRIDGSLDEAAISVLCRSDELPGISARVREALAGQPFAVEPGESVGGKVELVIRPSPR